MKDDGGPAFPQHYCDNCNDAFESPNGMTLRDYFAGQAMTAIIGDMNYISTFSIDAPSEISRISYRFADAMIAERNK